MDAGLLSIVGAERGACPLLFDVTRLVSLRWTGRVANGIDRVCLAYLRHYRHRALAVVQHRGVILVLDGHHSRRLFDLLDDDGGGARRRIAALAGPALATARVPAAGSTYLNVSHTDYDLAAHARWMARHALRPMYLLHDLIPITHAEHCRPHAVRRHRGRVIGALKHGVGIIVSSRAVEWDLRQFAARQWLETPPIIVAPIAGASLCPDAVPVVDRRGYFLCIGTIESRKNHALLFEVWRRLRARLGDDAPRLVIVGAWGSGVAAMRAALDASAMLGGLVEVIEGCDDGRLAGLIAGARAVLMPTLAEGYGLPMAEALALGAPVIASDLPCFHEVGQGIPCLLDPRDVDAWEARIAAFDEATARRQRQIVRLAGYRPVTWDEHFARVDPWLATVVAGTPHAPFPSDRASPSPLVASPGPNPGQADHPIPSFLRD